MVVIGSILLSSCDSYLDIQPVGQVIPTTLTEYRALLTTAYGLKLIDKSVTEFRTDIAMVTDNSNSQNFYSEIEKWNDMSPKDGTREFGWAVYYSVIYYANAIIANKDNIKEGSQEDIDQLVGEAYLLRGYMHFILANLYGQPYTKEGAPETKSIPIKWDLDLEVVLPRNTVKEVYTAILSDIESARGLMHQKEWEAVYAYRFSTLSVDAMESRVRLYMGNWKEAYDAAERILVQKSTLEDLNDPEAKLPNNYTSAEMITAYEFFNDDVTSASILIPAFMEKYDANKDLRRNKYYSLSGDKYISKKSGKAEHNCTFRTGEIYLNAAEACTVQEICLAAAACLAEANAFICRNGARIKAEHMQLHIVQVQRFKAVAQQQAQHLLAIALASIRLTADEQAHLAAAALPIYLFYAAVSNKPVL